MNDKLLKLKADAFSKDEMIYDEKYKEVYAKEKITIEVEQLHSDRETYDRA